MRRVLLVALVAAGVVASGCTASDQLAGNCVQNAFGAEFCGEDGRQMCREFGGPACADVYGMPTEGRVQKELERAEREIDSALESIESGCYEEWC